MLFKRLSICFLVSIILSFLSSFVAAMVMVALSKILLSFIVLLSGLTFSALLILPYLIFKKLQNLEERIEELEDIQMKMTGK